MESWKESDGVILEFLLIFKTDYRDSGVFTKRIGLVFFQEVVWTFMNGTIWFVVWLEFTGVFARP